jgi:4-hydroxybenzoate polyprenyltransferase
MNLQAVLKLTRWREFLLFTAVLTWLGGLTAYQMRDAQLDAKLFIVLLANLAAMAYAFMINDIEDAADDAHEEGRGSRNPITSGELSKRAGWIAAFGTAILALICYALAGRNVLIIGVIILVLAHLYSWHGVRLKALPIVDILSHAMFLSMLLYLAAFFAYSTHLGELWVMALGTFLVSAYGQLYNQVRDYDSDRAAGLNNTASVLGKKVVMVLAYGSMAGFVLSLVISTFQGVFPLWLGPVLIVAMAVVLYWTRGNMEDMRGTATNDPIAKIQEPFLIIFNVVLISWYISTLF